MGLRKLKEFLGINALRLAILISVLFLFVFVILIFVKGGKLISFTFLTQPPKAGMTKGGDFHIIFSFFIFPS